MEFVDYMQLGIGVVVVIGLILTWFRNGKLQGTIDGELKQQIQGLIKEVGKTETLAKETNQGITEIKLNCANVSTKLCERVNAHDKEIDRLRNNRKKSRS